MMNMQYLVDGMSAQWQKDRAETQMTLGKLMDRLAALPPETPIGISRPHSYRGYYSNLSFEPTKEPIPASDALALCKGAMGEVFTGYKGGEFQMGRNTPVWIANYGECGDKIMAILDDGIMELQKDEL